jgi:hypothetical protein
LINSSETAAGVNTPKSVNNNVISCAGVKSTVGISFSLEVIRFIEGLFIILSLFEEAAENDSEGFFTLCKVSFCVNGYILANLYDSTAT